jgi:chemotaxis protein MotB
MRHRSVAVVVSVLIAGCGVDKDKYLAKELEAQQNLRKYQDESQKAADLERKLADVDQKLAASQRQVDDLVARKTQLEQEKGALQAKSAQYEQLATSLKSQIDAGQIELSELRGKMTVKLKDKILFASGSAAVGRAGRAALDAVADAFKSLKGKNVVVSGYTDDVPTGRKGIYEDNWDLSTARAVAVVRYLQGKGVDPGVLGAAGFSQYRPLAPNDTVEGRSQNRRIEIALTAADYTPPVAQAPK